MHKPGWFLSLFCSIRLQGCSVRLCCRVTYNLRLWVLPKSGPKLSAKNQRKRPTLTIWLSWKCLGNEKPYTLIYRCFQMYISNALYIPQLTKTHGELLSFQPLFLGKGNVSVIDRQYCHIFFSYLYALRVCNFKCLTGEGFIYQQISITEREKPRCTIANE